MRTKGKADIAGFSLIETLVASALVASVLIGLAHLIAVGAHQSLRSRRAAAGVAFVQSKLEELRNATWGYDHNGMSVSGDALATSPPSSLTEDTPGYVDYVSPHGEVVALDGPDLPDFARRWSIAMFDASDPDTLILHVCGYGVRGRAGRDAIPIACASTVRTRKP
jgi:hypothetical protein